LEKHLKLIKNKEGEGQMLFPLQEGEIVTDIPRLGQCYLCKTWRLEKDLSPIEIPDQGGGYVQKSACESCLDEILGEKKDHGADDSC
jgi:hypothetical protein